MSDSGGKAFYTGFLQLFWPLPSCEKSLSRSLEKGQCKNNNLPRQHAVNSIFTRGLVDGKRYTDIHISTLTLSDQYQKVVPRANINFRIFRSDDRFWRNDFEPFQRELSHSAESMLESNKLIKSFSSTLNVLNSAGIKFRDF